MYNNSGCSSSNTKCPVISTEVLQLEKANSIVCNVCWRMCTNSQSQTEEWLLIQNTRTGHVLSVCSMAAEKWSYWIFKEHDEILSVFPKGTFQLLKYALNRSGDNCLNYSLQFFKWCPHIISLHHILNQNKITSDVYVKLLNRYIQIVKKKLY